MTKRILITGEGGFTGKYLSDFLQRRYDCEIHGLGHVRQDPRLKVNLLNFDDLSYRINFVRPTHVVHLAAISFVSPDKISNTYNTNVVGTTNLLTTLLPHSNIIEKIIIVSSASVYQRQKIKTPLDEHANIAPYNHYGISKRCMEQLAELYKGDLPIDIVRPFNYTGVGQSENFLVPKIVNSFKRKAHELLLGNLDVERDFSDIRSIVYALSKLLFLKESGKLYNISSGEVISIREIIHLCEVITNHSLDIKENPCLVRNNELKSLLGNPKSLINTIGDFRLYNFQETLDWMFSVDANSSRRF